MGLCSLPVVWLEGYDRGNGSTPPKGLRHTLLYSVPLTPQQVIVDPCLCQRLLYTQRQVWISLLWRYCSQPTRTAKIKKIDIRDVKQLKSSYFAGRKAKEYSHFRKQFDKFLQSEAYILYTNVYTGFIYNS